MRNWTKTYPLSRLSFLDDPMIQKCVLGGVLDEERTAFHLWDFLDSNKVLSTINAIAPAVGGVKPPIALPRPSQ